MTDDLGKGDSFLIGQRRALPGHYPGVFAGLTHSRGACHCGWRGVRHWGIGREATHLATEDYVEHIMSLNDGALLSPGIPFVPD